MQTEDSGENMSENRGEYMLIAKERKYLPKVLSLVLGFTMMITLFVTQNAYADDVAESGIYALYYQSNQSDGSCTLIIQNDPNDNSGGKYGVLKDLQQICDGGRGEHRCEWGLSSSPYYKLTTNVIFSPGVQPHSLRKWFSDFDRLESVDFSGLDSSLVTDMTGMFANCSRIKTIDMSHLNANCVAELGEWVYPSSGLFENCIALSSVKLPENGFPNAASFDLMFWNCQSIRSVDLFPLSTSQVESMIGMFAGCISLKELDLSTLDLSKVTAFSGHGDAEPTGPGAGDTFLYGGLCNHCTSLTAIDLSNQDLSSLVLMEGAFLECTSLRSVNLSNSTAPNLFTVEDAFSGCTSLADFRWSGFQAPKLSKVGGLFAGCSSLVDIDLSDLDVTFLEDTSGMFVGCTKLKTVSMPKTKANLISSAQGMFGGCESLTNIDLSWIESTTLEPTNANALCDYCPNLKTIKVGEVTDWRNILPGDICNEDTVYRTVDYVDSKGSKFKSSTLPKSANTYTIEQAYSFPISECTVEYPEDIWFLKYNGRPHCPKPVITYNDDSFSLIPLQKCILKENVDYILQYHDNTAPGQATITIKGIGKWTGSIEVKFWIAENPQYVDNSVNPSIPSSSSLSSHLITKAAVSVKDKTHTGKAQKATAATVKLGGKTLKLGRDFTISSKSGKNIGTYKVTITGIGAYTGTKTVTFKIVPKGTSVSKLTKGKKAFTVKWKKPSKANLKQTTGYQVRWSTAKSMKGAKSKTVKATSSTGKKCQIKVAKLKANKKYYVQVRTYKKVGGKMYYSIWSKAKAVKTKK